MLPNEESHNNNNTNKNIMFYWFFVFLTVMICILSCYALYKVVISRPEANILMNNNTLSPYREKQIHEKLKLSVQGNFFTANLHHITNQITSLDWVNTVKVARQWPNGMAIDVLPHYAVARFGSERLVSSDGSVYLSQDMRLEKYHTLPLLFGPKDKAKEIMNQYYQINQWFKPVGIKLKELSVSEHMTWLLKFDSGLSIKVDNENNEKKLFNFSRLLQTKLLSEKDNIKSVDLRYKNNTLAIKFKDDNPSQLDKVLSGS